MAIDKAKLQEFLAPPVKGPIPAIVAAQTETTQPEANSGNQPAESSTATAAVEDESVVTSAESTPAAAEEAATAPAGETTESGAAKPRAGRAQERIEGLVDENKALREFAEYWREQALKGATPPAPGATSAAPAPAAQAAPAPAAADEAPTLESCDFDTAKWTRAMQTWTQKQIQTGVKAALQGVQQQQSADTVRAQFVARADAFKATVPDFDVVLNNPRLPPLAPDAASLVVASELGPQIAYHLGRHPDKAARIARLPAAQQAAAIGRLEAELSAAKPSQKTQTTTTTKAPPPPSATPSGGPSGGSKDPSKMTMDEFVAQERAAAAQRRARIAARR